MKLRNLILLPIAGLTAAVPALALASCGDKKSTFIIEFTTKIGTIKSGGQIKVKDGTLWKDVPKPEIELPANYSEIGFLFETKLLNPNDKVTGDMSVELLAMKPANENEVWWDFDEDNKTAKIYHFQPQTENLWIPSEIEHNNETYTVTGIYENPFFQTEALKLVNLILPKTLVDVPEHIFIAEHTDNVRNIIIDPENEKYTTADNDGNQCNCIIDKETHTIINGVGKFFIPDGVKKINQFAFIQNTETKNVDFPASLEEIGEDAFHWSSLTSVFIPKTIKKMGTGVFSQCDYLKKIEIEDGVESISSSCFSQTPIKSIVIPNSITEIPTAAFADCRFLSDVELSPSLKTIGLEAFVSCPKLTKIKFPESLETIGDQAFAQTSLTELFIPKQVKNISKTNTPFNFTKLKSIKVDVDNQNFTSRDENEQECNCLIEKNTKTLISGSSTSIIPSGILVIGKNAFEGVGFESPDINIPDSVTTINKNAFSYSRFKNIHFGKNLSSVADDSFLDTEYRETIKVDPENENYTSWDENGQECNCLINKEKKSVTLGSRYAKIPKNVERLGPHSFESIKWLSNIEIPENIKILDNYCFFLNNSLRSLTIGNNIDEIHWDVASKCGTLLEIKFEKDISSAWPAKYDDLAFSQGVRTSGIFYVKCATDEELAQRKDLILKHWNVFSSWNFKRM